MRPAFNHMIPIRAILLLATLGGLTLLAVAPAVAYVGPGAGISLLSALWGLVVAITMTLGFVVLWPLRRYIFDRRHKPSTSDDPDRDDR